MRHWTLWPDASAAKTNFFLCLLLIALTLAIYCRVHDHPFSELDDFVYVTDNAHVKDGLSVETIKWSFTTFHASNWHPLTWLSHALDCQIYDLNPAGHHDTSLILHILNAVLLFVVIERATRYPLRSFVVAALFAVHPINVESVAWVAERKTVLATVFFLLALGAYRWYASRPRIGRYLLVSVLFFLGLMAKPQVITLPLVLLLWDYWPLERVSLKGDAAPSSNAGFPQRTPGFLVLEKLPLLGLALADAALTMKAQAVEGVRFLHYPLGLRIDNAIFSYVRYLGKAVWPFGLAPEYPHPGNSLQAWEVFASFALLLAITAFVVVWRRHRYLPVGWFWFLIVLLPMIGIVQVGRQGMADRYAYQSFIGLFVLVCWSAGEAAAKLRLTRLLLPAASVLLLAALAVVSCRQVGYWKDDRTLWSHALQTVTNHWVAEGREGMQSLKEGREDEAMAHFRRAAAIYPLDSISNLNLAIYAQRHGNLQEAILRYKQSLPETQSVENAVKIYTNMSIAYGDLGDSTMASQCAERADRLRAEVGRPKQGGF